MRVTENDRVRMNMAEEQERVAVVRRRLRSPRRRRPSLPLAYDDEGNTLYCIDCGEQLRDRILPINYPITESYTSGGDLEFGLYRMDARWCGICETWFHWECSEVPLPGHQSSPELCPQGDCRECDVVHTNLRPSSLADTQTPDGDRVRGRAGEVTGGAEGSSISEQGPNLPASSPSPLPQCIPVYSFHGQVIDMNQHESWTIEREHFDRNRSRWEPWVDQAWTNWIQNNNLEFISDRHYVTVRRRDAVQQGTNARRPEHGG